MLRPAALLLFLLFPLAVYAQPIVLVVNSSSPVSVQIVTYYAKERSIPERQICRISVSPAEHITRPDYDQQVAKPLAQCLKSRNLTESTSYLVTTLGVPLRIDETAQGRNDQASVDSELALLYADLHGQPHPLAGPAPNPFFAQTAATFSHPRFPMYFVTRLAGYDWNDVKGVIDRCRHARNAGRFIFDLKTGDSTPGNGWLRAAASALPRERVVLENTGTVVEKQQNVIGYASWGSNDLDRKNRFLAFSWLPGAIMTEFVSTNGRTFIRPPDSWNLGSWRGLKSHWYADSPQTLTADYLHEGATGASGHVDEPYLAYTPRPDFLFPAYFAGRNLAESYYMAIPALSWQNIVVGDPLCSLGPP